MISPNGTVDSVLRQQADRKTTKTLAIFQRLKKELVILNAAYFL